MVFTCRHARLPLKGYETSSTSSREMDSPTTSTRQNSSRVKGTGVFIRSCFLDSAVVPLVPGNKQPLRSVPRRHSCCHAPEAIKQCTDSSSSRCCNPAAADTPSSAEEHRRSRRHSYHHDSRGCSQSASAQTSFSAAADKAVHQQQRCDVLSGANCCNTADAATICQGAGSTARGASLNTEAMPPAGQSMPAVGCRVVWGSGWGLQQQDGRQSSAGCPVAWDSAPLDTGYLAPAPPPRASLESWGYVDDSSGSSSCDMHSYSWRLSMDSSSAPSVRSSMDCATGWSGHPSVSTACSAYAPAALPPHLTQQQHAAAAAASAAGAGTRASVIAALLPAPAGNPWSRTGLCTARRASCDYRALPPSVGDSDRSLYSVGGTDINAAAAAAASTLQMQQQCGMGGLLHPKNSTMSNLSSTNVCGSNMLGAASPASNLVASSAPCIPLENSLPSSIPGLSSVIASNADTLAALAAQGVDLDTAVLLVLQARESAAAAAVSLISCGGRAVSDTVLHLQHQLQQRLRARQGAAGCGAPPAPVVGASSELFAAAAALSEASQRPLQYTTQWPQHGCDTAEDEPLLLLLQQQVEEAEASMLAGLSAAALQQQLDILQQMQP